MINRDDPLIQSVEKIMKDTVIRRQIEESVNAEFSIQNRKQLTLEQVATYDALLEKRISEALHPNQQKLDVHEPEKDELTSQDFKMLRAKKTMKEEEQLDETSKKKAWIHAMAAKDEIANIRAKAGKDDTDWTDNNLSDKDKNTIRKRTAGLIRTAKKLTSEEVEQLDEISRDLASRYIQKAKTSTKDAYYGDDAPTMGKRKKGIDLALKKKWGDKKHGLDEPKVKATNEEVKQLDELSSETLTSYVKKATTSANRSVKLRDKRVPGIQLANKKLNKEEVEQLDEAQTPQQKAAQAALATQEGSYDRGKKGGAINRMALMKKKDLEKIAKGKSQEEKVEKIDEMAPPGAKYERMIKHIKSGYAKNGLTDKEKSIAYATAWKAKNKNEQ